MPAKLKERAAAVGRAFVDDPTQPGISALPPEAPDTGLKFFGKGVGKSRTPEGLFSKIEKASHRLAGGVGKSRVWRTSLDKNINRLAVEMSEGAVKSVGKADLKTIREFLIRAARTGKAKPGDLGLMASSALIETGVVPQTETGFIKRIAQKFGASGTATGLKKVGTLAKVGRFAAGQAPFAGLLVADQLLKGRRRKQGEQEQIRQILEEQGKGGTSAFGPIQTVEFIEALGPDFLDAISQDPALAIALQDRLQSAAGGGLPPGAAVLRAEGPGGGGGMDIEALLAQMGG